MMARFASGLTVKPSNGLTAQAALAVRRFDFLTVRRAGLAEPRSGGAV